MERESTEELKLPPPNSFLQVQGVQGNIRYFLVHSLAEFIHSAGGGVRQGAGDLGWGSRHNTP